MSSSSSFSPLGRGSRAACTAVAALCAAGLQVGMLGLFDQASAEPWINPSEHMLQALAHCDSLQQLPRRQQCTRELVARARTPATWSAQAAVRLAPGHP